MTARFIRSLGLAVIAAIGTGCTSFSADGGMDTVSRLSRDRIGVTVDAAIDAGIVQQRVDELLALPLSADSAIEIAVLNQRGLRARLREVGLAEADLVQAGRLRNPSLGYSHIRGSGTVEIERSITVDLVGLLTMPLAVRIERSRFEQAQYQAALDIVTVAAETRRAWVDAVAARQLAGYRAQVVDAADAASELARRMRAAGNFNKLSQLREQAFHGDAIADAARATLRSSLAREHLIRMLGLSSGNAMTLPDRLPDLPAQLAPLVDAEQTAMERRLDIWLARRSAQAQADAWGLTRATRFVNVLDAGYRNKSESGTPRLDGYQISLELPLFDFGSARNARAETAYLQALDRAADIAINARSQVREAQAGSATAWQLARHYRDTVLPLRQQIADENLLRYNGMLIDVFELIADAREQITGVTAYVEALRDYWIADTELQTAMTGRS
ncbi:TolC family protein [soil metagenome]